MKKILALVLSLTMVLSLAACGSKPASSTAPVESKPAESTAAPSAAPVEEKKLDYPKKNISLVVPYASGGSSDMAARALADFMTDKLGVNVVVNNSAGAGGAIGTASVVNSKGDGYTLLMGSVGPLTISPYSSDTGYTYKDLKLVSQVTDLPIGIAVHKDSEFQTLQDLVDYCKANPGKLQIGNIGAGNIQHVAVSSVCQWYGIDVVHVPYEGANPACAALLGQNIPVICTNFTELTPYYKSGDFRILALTCEERFDVMPDVPTLTELGCDVVYGGYFGICAPGDTDDAIIDFLDDVLAEALQDETVLNTMEKLFLAPSYKNSEDFLARVENDAKKNEEILTQLGLHK